MNDSLGALIALLHTSPVSKLVKTVCDQFGLFLEPTHIRRRASAEADAALTKARAGADIEVIECQNKLVIQKMEDRAAQRVRRLEARRQKNLERIAVQAARELPETVSDQPVDDDWVAQFLNHAQDISNERMQSLWARILAGEVAKPGSFSLRTLAVVRVMSKEDADTFTRFCSVVWQLPLGLTAIVPLLPNLLTQVGGVNLTYFDFVRMESLGLLKLNENQNIVADVGCPTFTCTYFGQDYIVSLPHLTQGAQFPLCIGRVLMTDVARELFPIAGASPNEEHRRNVVTFLRQSGWEVAESAKDAAAE